MPAESRSLLADLAAFLEHHQLATLVLAGLTLRGLFDFIEWMAGFLVEWIIKMSNHWHHLVITLPPSHLLSLGMILIGLSALGVFRGLRRGHLKTAQ